MYIELIQTADKTVSLCYNNVLQGLADNNIGSNGAEFLCKMLGENYAISTLDLSSES